MLSQDRSLKTAYLMFSFVIMSTTTVRVIFVLGLLRSQGFVNTDINKA